eukprot:65028_1
MVILVSLIYFHFVDIGYDIFADTKDMEVSITMQQPKINTTNNKGPTWCRKFISSSTNHGYSDIVGVSLNEGIIIHITDELICRRIDIENDILLVSNKLLIINNTNIDGILVTSIRAHDP